MRFSPSALSLYAMCPRRWALKAIAKIPEPPRAAADLGTDTHRLIDKYSGRESLAGADPKAVLCAQPALKIVQEETEKGYKSLVEDSYEFNFEGNTFIGRIDRVTFTPEVTIVRDWKTCRTFNFCLEPEELVENEQAVIYSWAQYNRGSTFVRNDWVYLSTGTPGKSKIVSVDQPKEDNKRRLVVLNERAEDMKKMKATVDPYDFPANFMACDKYPPHGCPYHVSKGGGCDPFEIKEEELEMPGLADRIKAGKLTPAMLGMEDASAAPAQTQGLSSLVPLEETVATNPAPLKPEVVTPPVVVEEPVVAAPETITVETPVEEKKKPGRKPGSKNKPKEETFQEAVQSEEDFDIQAGSEKAFRPLRDHVHVSINFTHKDGFQICAGCSLERLDEVVAKLRNI
jgi:hypothetical protein